MLGGNTGGEYSYRQLESLWLSAGGRRSLAPTMAAIAEAESGGNPAAENPSGATGLWEILGAVRRRDQSRLTNPNVNAREAVLKWQTQGLDAWETYTSGAYRKFLRGGTVQQGVASGEAFVREAQKFDGTPYVWGGTNPKGFDCSGLVQYALEKLGLKNVPRTSEQQWAWSKHIKRSDLRPGDLVFYAGSDGTATSPGHVAIYAGNNQVIQAEETGTTVGKFPLTAAGQPVGYGRVPGLVGVIGGGSGGGGNSFWSEVAQSVLAGGTAFGVGSGISPDQASGGPLGAIAAAVVRTEQAITWFFVPSHWLRIIAFLVGVPLVGIGIVTMTRTGHGYSASYSLPGVGSQTVPAPGGQLAPALGIAEVTMGAILLFVAFHNLDAENVHDFGSLISYLQGAVQRQGAHATSGGG